MEDPDFCDDMSIMNHDDGMVEGSIETQDYGVRKQGNRSGRHTSSLCNTARTLHTDNFITNTHVDCSAIPNHLYNDSRRNHITTTTKRN